MDDSIITRLVKNMVTMSDLMADMAGLLEDIAKDVESFKEHHE